MPTERGGAVRYFIISAITITEPHKSKCESIWKAQRLANFTDSKGNNVSNQNMLYMVLEKGLT